MSSTCSRACSECTNHSSASSRLVCRCLKISEDVVLHAITVLGLGTVKEIRAATGAGDGCTCCHKLLQRYIDSHYQPVTLGTIGTISMPALATA